MRFSVHTSVVGGLRPPVEDNWADLGEFPIAGFSKAERIYGLAEETPPSTAS
jgi:hypothetical protein